MNVASAGSNPSQHFTYKSAKVVITVQYSSKVQVVVKQKAQSRGVFWLNITITVSDYPSQGRARRLAGLGDSFGLRQELLHSLGVSLGIQLNTRRGTENENTK